MFQAMVHSFKGAANRIVYWSHLPNWVPTKVGGRFEVMFRLYGPEQAFFDKKWKLPDIEKMK
jgi:hypothetical protein